jgi:predicted phage tail protein
MPATNKPAGSGWFSLIVGIASILIVAIFWLLGKDATTINGNYIIAAWMIFSGVVMAVWGIVRIATATAQTDLRIGQNTINFCVAIIGVTFAILAIVVDK